MNWLRILSILVTISVFPILEAQARNLTFEERVAAQRAIEQVQSMMQNDKSDLADMVDELKKG